jgi:hypothetical protein
MTSGSPVSLQGLTSFKAIVGYELRQTVLDIWSAGSSHPVARLAKTGPLLRPGAYGLYTGPGLSEVTAHVTPSGAQYPDGTPIGIVNLGGGRHADGAIQPLSGARHSYVVHNPARWRIVQPGLPPLPGEAVGSTRLHHNRLTDFIERAVFPFDIVPYPIPNLLALMRFRFSAPGSAGFTVKFRVGQSRIQVTMADPHLDRRLIFACLTALAALNMWTPRGELVDMAAPFRRHRRDRGPATPPASP